MKNKISQLLLLAFFFCVDVSVFAQGGPGDTGDGGLEGGDPAPAPINTNLYFLIIAAFVYAGYKTKSYKASLK
jgi:hypothetical protein